MPHDSPTWCLHDGAAGHRQQAWALARALDPAARELALVTRAPWSWLAPRRLPGADAAFGAAFRTLLDAPPALAVGCGRRPALATRLLGARGTRTVQLLDPRLDPSHWDLVVAPAHDGLRGPNVVTLCGSLNPVDDAWLADGRAAFPGFAALPSPRTVVLLGGRTPAVRFDRGAFEVMAARLEHWLAVQGGSLLVIGSRRTPAQLAMLSRSYWADTPGLRWFDASDGPNPYAGALAWADRVVVSPDSVNMVSEACATAAPVYVAEPGRATGRVKRYLDDLLARGRIQALGKLPHDVAAEPVRELARVVAALKERL
ncbi:MAG TPA: mitochondrial fission ELM1 family protein [Arenimonas sp.]|uniref:mitochondrial fission ELM1 family protein n=1 Tax=Arenimonas sp. TaxID=1872635 RepID=UPI002D809A2C|nr:mitochondrial fission ELM1 family protein [Arenimonas sp.]HEU0152909.1 mitochondrial fission ELM1 family protein [Arenimonas sp.]